MKNNSTQTVTWAQGESGDPDAMRWQRCTTFLYFYKMNCIENFKWNVTMTVT